MRLPNTKKELGKYFNISNSCFMHNKMILYKVLHCILSSYWLSVKKLLYHLFGFGSSFSLPHICRKLAVLMYLCMHVCITLGNVLGEAFLDYSVIVLALMD